MDRRARSSITLLLALIASLVLAVAPAWAHHKDGHDNGGGQSSGQGNEDDDGIPDDNTDNQHPSGNDRETNDGPTDDEQGSSSSDPDDDGRGPDRSNGGPDKNGGTGGENLEDQDGNNGCGNDDDFEDDNEGWCGKPPTQVQGTQQTSDEKTCEEIMGSREACDDDVLGSHDEKTCVELMGSEEACDEDDDALGGVIRREANPTGDDVLGVRFGATTAPGAPAVAAETVASPGEVLPFTGAGLVPFAAFGLALIGAGSALLVRKSA